MSDKLVALVTGASRGIGRAIAERLAHDGYSVVGTATSETGAANIQEALTAISSDCSGMVLNVTDAESIAHVIDAINTKYGTTPNVLVNNAGITRDNIVMRMKDHEWDDIISTNLTSIFRLTKACLRGMTKKRFGRIVTIGSVIGSIGNVGQANYAAAKAGLIGYSKSLAKEVGSRGITVNVVAPGFIGTDMTEALPEEQRDALLKQIPLGTMGKPEDIAAAVAFLTSEQGGYITGETLHVNGGMYTA